VLMSALNKIHVRECGFVVDRDVQLGTFQPELFQRILNQKQTSRDLIYRRRELLITHRVNTARLCSSRGGNRLLDFRPLHIVQSSPLGVEDPNESPCFAIFCVW
jgi:hypothetical protein